MLANRHAPDFFHINFFVLNFECVAFRLDDVKIIRDVCNQKFFAVDFETGLSSVAESKRQLCKIVGESVDLRGILERIAFIGGIVIDSHRREFTEVTFRSDFQINELHAVTFKAHAVLFNGDSARAVGRIYRQIIDHEFARVEIDFGTFGSRDIRGRIVVEGNFLFAFRRNHTALEQIHSNFAVSERGIVAE